jgi:hypothetical protein
MKNGGHKNAVNDKRNWNQIEGKRAISQAF